MFSDYSSLLTPHSSLLIYHLSFIIHLTLPPFTFTPILKPTAWGGTRIAAFKGIEGAGEQIGESWELSGVAGSLSVVDKGPYAGLTLSDLMARFGSRLVGDRVYARCGNTFPLLIKYIDAAHDLSIQVHPDDPTARRLLHQPNGKTEMWYILSAAADARIVYGFNRPVTPQLLADRCRNDRVMEILGHRAIQEGDIIYIPAGLVHAICSHTFLIEIQQTSDATFRLYDYGRPRPLHIDQAIQSIHYNEPLPPTLSGSISCPYFSARCVSLRAEQTLTLGGDSFHILINYSAPLLLTPPEGAPLLLATGQTALLAAETPAVTLSPATAEPCRLLSVACP